MVLTLVMSVAQEFLLSFPGNVISLFSASFLSEIKKIAQNSVIYVFIRKHVKENFLKVK